MKNKISASIESSIVAEVDAYAKANDLNRSEAIELLCTKALEKGAFFEGPTVESIHAIAPLNEVYALMNSQKFDASQFEGGLRIPTAELTLRIGLDDYRKWLEHLQKNIAEKTGRSPVQYGKDLPKTGVTMIHIPADETAHLAKSTPKPKKPSPKPKRKHP